MEYYAHTMLLFTYLIQGGEISLLKIVRLRQSLAPKVHEDNVARGFQRKFVVLNWKAVETTLSQYYDDTEN